MNPMSVIGLVSSIALILPLILMITSRLVSYKNFPALFLYYLLILAYNVVRSQYFPVNTELINGWNLLNNFLDAPLVIYFLTYFSTSVPLTKKMNRIIAGILVFQVAVVSIMGFNNDAISVFMGPGLVLVFAFSLHFFVRQTKITISHQKAAGKAIITASLLFAYGCYAMLYVVYYVLKMPNIQDTFIIYYAVITLSSAGMAIGIIAESKRVRKLNELLQTRKELSVIYKNETQTARTIRSVALDFDKDPWV